MNKYSFLITMSMLLSLTSCKKTWLNVNNDPNRVTDANITAELIFPSACNEVGQLAAGQTAIEEWVGYMAPNGTFVPVQNVISYNIDFTFADGLFQTYYNVLFDLHQAEVKAKVNGDLNLEAASIILSAKLFQEVTDYWGDVPYSQAFQPDQYPTPVYDASQSIYSALQSRLDSAITILENNSSSDAFSAADIINHGDAGKWIKFANTLKLRLLIRQSRVSGFDPSPEIAKIANGGNVLANILGAGESISVNPGYVNDVNKQQPFYAKYGWTPSGVQTNQAFDANNYIISILENTNDPRLAEFFYPAGFDLSNGYVGNIFGDPVGSLAQGSQSSYFGPALVGQLNSSGVGLGYSADQFIYPGYESLFLYAEAVANGWIADNVDTALANAIRESFVWTGVSNPITSANQYMANNNILDSLDAASGTLAKDQCVAYQKYIANTEVDPNESFFDINRLHVLKDNSYISTLPSKISSFLPLRLLYAQSEYTTNALNTPKEISGDEFNKKLFWEP